MDVSSHICLVLLNVRDNEKLEMQQFFCIYYDVYTTDDTERIHETERMQISNLKNDEECYHLSDMKVTAHHKDDLAGDVCRQQTTTCPYVIFSCFIKRTMTNSKSVVLYNVYRSCVCML